MKKKINGKAMGEHIDKKGRFQSDKYPDLKPDKIVLSFHDPEAKKAIREYAWATSNLSLARDIIKRLNEIDRQCVHDSTGND